MYPFLFGVLGENDKIAKYVVVLATDCDYTYASTDWMNDPRLPDGRTLGISIDLFTERFEFDTEAEAISFIKEWWKLQL